MKLEEYLKEKLNISDEKAKEIVDVFHAYKKEYKHSHKHHDGNENQNVYAQILASEAFCTSVGNNLEQLHCNCCPNHCLLSEPMCGRGQRVQDKLLQKVQN